MNKEKEPDCRECEFMKKYDYGNRIYYCDHADRIDGSWVLVSYWIEALSGAR